MEPDLHRMVLCDAEKYLLMVEGYSYQLQWFGVDLASILCKRAGIVISEAVGTGLYPNITAVRTMINEAITSLSQKGDK